MVSDPCDPNPCRNGGTCRAVVPGSEDTEFICACDRQFTGATCEIPGKFLVVSVLELSKAYKNKKSFDREP